MAEYIEREELLKRLDMAIDCKNCPRCVDMQTYYDRCAYTDIQDVCGVISDIPTADVQPVDRWISVDQRLPKDGEEALVYAGNRGVMIGLYDSVLQVWLDYECCGLKVTHWQPLPEPPKKEG